MTIVSSFEGLDRYAGLSPRFAAAFAWIRSGAWKDLPEGKHQIDGDKLFASVQAYETKAFDQGLYEAHDRYVDIQFLADGSERIWVRARKGLAVSKPYDAAKEIVFFADAPGAETPIALEPGNAAILFPECAHKPCISIDAPRRIRKVVVKVAI